LKIARAISEMQSNGIKVLLPDINKADFGFAPDLENNAIIFGLKGISNVGDEVAFNIIAKRPYVSLIDFIEKTNTSKIATINLIKGGAFDQLESQSRNKERTEIMKDYLDYMANKEFTPKDSLNLQNLDKIIELNILDENEQINVRYYNFNKYISNKEFFIEKKKNKNYYIAKEKAFNFFEQHYVPKLKEGTDYWYTNEGIIFCKSSYDKIYKERMNQFINLINMPKLVGLYNKTVYNKYVQGNWNKYCQGSISSWEMDSLSYYYHDHELKNINKEKYNITDFSQIPEQPVVESYYFKKGKQYPKYYLYKIIGTVLDRDKNKHIVSLLTLDGVVSVKFYEGSFRHYDKQLSVVSDDKKEVVEKSWFQRGTKLMICGIRREDCFIPKKYFDSIYSHTVCLIEDIQGDELILKLERESV
jgi:DNA polymerase-3 subunit alpha